MDALSNREIKNRARVFNTATPATTQNILTTSLSPTNYEHGYFRVYACFSTAVKLSVKVTVGAATVTEDLNGGNDLAAGAAYLFDVPVFNTETINFCATYASGSPTTNRLVIDEYSG